MNETHETMTKAWMLYLEENDKFTIKGVKAAAGRARKALNDVRKLEHEKKVSSVQQQYKAPAAEAPVM